MAEVLSPYLIALVLAWFLSHVIKYVVLAIKLRKLKTSKKFFSSGGMPSAHTATVTAVWTVVLLQDGWSSGLFGLATALLVVVAYDAATVRRSVGEQRLLLAELTKDKLVAKRLYASQGHTIIEVISGLGFGALVGLAVYLPSLVS